MLADSKAFSGFSVDDLEVARKFYEDILGLSTQDTVMGTMGLKLGGGLEVLVYPSPNHQPASFTVLNFPVEDIEAAVAGLTERGVSFEKYEGTPMETDASGIFRGEGPLIAWFKDPAGNVMSVIDQSSVAAAAGQSS
jgi:catechol 2,3-dioxygenase-like lactoylglutathione lyase family enzyme